MLMLPEVEKEMNMLYLLLCISPFYYFITLFIVLTYRKGCSY